MTKRSFLIGAVALAALAIIPDNVLATTLGGEEELVSLAKGLEGYLFGAPMKIAAFCGASYGCILAVIQQAYAKAIGSIGFGIFAVKIPAIINSIYGDAATATISQFLGQ